MTSVLKTPTKFSAGAKSLVGEYSTAAKLLSNAEHAVAVAPTAARPSLEARNDGLSVSDGGADGLSASKARLRPPRCATDVGRPLDVRSSAAAGPAPSLPPAATRA